MTFVVGEQCIKCKHTDCVEVCPVDCFYEGPNFLVIHPDECIDCALCEPECPVDAIYSEDIVTSLSAMNQAVEKCIAIDPAQYLWSYRRFKTQPPGVPDFYA